MIFRHHCSLLLMRIFHLVFSSIWSSKRLLQKAWLEQAVCCSKQAAWRLKLVEGQEAAWRLRLEGQEASRSKRCERLQLVRRHPKCQKRLDSAEPRRIRKNPRPQENPRSWEIWRNRGGTESGNFHRNAFKTRSTFTLMHLTGLMQKRNFSHLVQVCSPSLPVNFSLKHSQWAVQ